MMFWKNKGLRLVSALAMMCSRGGCYAWCGIADFGAIGKLGNAYTIDAKMFSVATGAAESMKSITYSGAVKV